MLGKNSSIQQFEIFLFFSPKNKIQHFMQIVSLGDNLHKMSNPISREKEKKKISICCLLNLPIELVNPCHAE